MLYDVEDGGFVMRTGFLKTGIARLRSRMYNFTQQMERLRSQTYYFTQKMERLRSQTYYFTQKMERQGS